MSKLSVQKKFIDLSDYGRPIAAYFAHKLAPTTTTPIQVTLVFGVCGLIATYCIVQQWFVSAGVFLILKSIIDGIDGELARLKNTPSYTGRYLDSIFDNVLNLLFFITIAYTAHASYLLALAAYACMQLQGTLYNYYYVILRNNSKGGDTTSNIFETKTPTAFATEQQRYVNILFAVYIGLYGIYDKIIYSLDASAASVSKFPRWFMTLLSIYGLGFQLLIMAVLLALGYIHIIIPFFIVYSIAIPLFIVVRKMYLH